MNSLVLKKSVRKKCFPDSGSGGFGGRFEDGRKGFGDAGGATGGRETKTTRTITRTEGQ